MFNWKKHARVLFGFILGVFAGVSVGQMIYPMIVSSFGIIGYEEPLILLVLDQWSMHIAALWGIGVASVAWTGGWKFGMSVLGIVGFVTGLFLGLAVLKLPTDALIMSTIITTTYGAVGGLILGKFWTGKV